MVKIFLTVRNRLAITKKCIEALKKHSTISYQLFVYDNATNYLIKEHFEYFSRLYEKGLVTQVTFTTEESTFHAFSKASTCNFFGRQHEEDPNKDKYTFLLFLDNDVIVTPKWDEKLKIAWKYVNKAGMNHIKVIGQLPGGIKNKEGPVLNIAGMEARAGRLGGSGFWSVRPNFFRDVGFLDLKQLVGQDKRHDQLYWHLLQHASKGKPYILGLRERLRIHCGPKVGSICNRLTRNKGPDRLNMIKFEHVEENISKMDFDEFFSWISNNRTLIKGW